MTAPLAVSIVIVWLLADVVLCVLWMLLKRGQRVKEAEYAEYTDLPTVSSARRKNRRAVRRATNLRRRSISHAARRGRHIRTSRFVARYYYGHP
jgi:hypothetical protein